MLTADFLLGSLTESERKSIQEIFLEKNEKLYINLDDAVNVWVNIAKSIDKM